MSSLDLDWAPNLEHVCTYENRSNLFKKVDAESWKGKMCITDIHGFALATKGKGEDNERAKQYARGFFF